MILDQLTLMSDDQDLAQSAGDYFSDVIDTGPDGLTTSQDAPQGVGFDIGKGTVIELLTQVTEDFASGGAPTLDVVLETATDEAFTTPIPLLTSPQYVLADLVAGKHLLTQHIPFGTERFLRVKYTIGTAATTAGKVTSGISHGLQSNSK